MITLGHLYNGQAKKIISRSLYLQSSFGHKITYAHLWEGAMSLLTTVFLPLLITVILWPAVYIHLKIS